MVYVVVVVVIWMGGDFDDLCCEFSEKVDVGFRNNGAKCM
jgi:hypothetical protein